ncbi:hypothetical protein L6Q96_06865 [Candidatus Binatia bacterium]|nr:hypothetical protein [Candidatus Binatia bacterium]
MRTPFDEVVEQIRVSGFHNHRREAHSDTVSRGIIADLTGECEVLRADLEADRVRCWLNVRTPGARQRKIDLLVTEPTPAGEPDLDAVRICVENKSVVTAHRNRDARFDDLNEALQVLHRVKSEAVLVATVIVGVADRVLNVPDRIKPMFRGRAGEFKEHILPRLSTGDQRLWTEFPLAVSANKPDDPAKTVAKFRQLPRRPPGLTHVVGYDYVLVVPAHIDNVNPPTIARDNALGIDVDAEYEVLLAQMCKAYKARWHL